MLLCQFFPKLDSKLELYKSRDALELGLKKIKTGIKKRFNLIKFKNLFQDLKSSGLTWIFNFISLKIFFSLYYKITAACCLHFWIEYFRYKIYTKGLAIIFKTVIKMKLIAFNMNSCLVVYHDTDVSAKARSKSDNL